MALATTCPQCKTSFKVVPDQLKLRRGLVRCGSCQNVFSGIDHLRYVEEPRAGAAAAPVAPDPLHTAFFLPETILANPPLAGGMAAPGMRSPLPGGSGALGPGAEPRPGPEPGSASEPEPATGEASDAGTSPSADADISASAVSSIGMAPETAPPVDTSDDEAARALRALERAERSLDLDNGLLRMGAGAARIDTSDQAIVAADETAQIADDADLDRIADADAADTTGGSTRAATPTDDAALAPVADEHAAPARPSAPLGLITDTDPSARDIDALAVPRQRTAEPIEEIESLLATTPRDFEALPLEPDEPHTSIGPAAYTAVDDAEPRTDVPATAHVDSPFTADPDAAPTVPADAPSIAPSDAPATPHTDATGIDVTGIDVTGIDATGIDPTGIDPTGIGTTAIDAASIDATSAQPAEAPALAATPAQPLRGRANGATNTTTDSAASPPFGRSERPTSDAALDLEAEEESAIDYFSAGRRGVGFIDRHGPLTLLAAALLTLLLIVQWTVAQRAMIAARWPALAPALSAVVQPFGLQLELPRDLQALTIESFELQDTPTPGVLSLSALLRNRAAYPVHWPAMQLTLTDPTNQVLVRKVLLPGDYLPSDTAQPGVPPRGEWPLRVALDAQDLQPAGYSVKLFYP